MDNCVHAAKRLLSSLNIKHTSNYLKDSILSHPDHPSLLSISDTLEKYQIETLAVKIDFEKLKSMPLPSIVQVEVNKQPLFFVLKDVKAKPVSHFLAIEEKGDKTKTKKALDDWYMAEQKDYEVFANKYPMNGELEQQKDKIEAMRNWCDAENITHTPTVFINGYELPKEYSIEDLKEVLQ